MEDLGGASAPTVQVSIEPLVPGAEAAFHEAAVLDAVLAGGGIAAFDPTLRAMR